MIDLNIVALMLEKVAALCRDIAQSGDNEVLQNFDPFEFLRGPMTIAGSLASGQQAGLQDCDDDLVRICRELTVAMGGTVDSESNPPMMLFNPPDRAVDESRHRARSKITEAAEIMAELFVTIRKNLEHALKLASYHELGVDPVAIEGIQRAILHESTNFSAHEQEQTKLSDDD
jgi:hypothetical protein